MSKKMVICQRCGKTIPPAIRGVRKYCPDSAKIRKKETNSKAQAKYYANHHTHYCAMCGKPFPAGTSVNRKYCADCGEELHRTQAREAARRKRQADLERGSSKRVDKPCQMCGKTMLQVVPGRKYCQECIRARDLARKKARPRPEISAVSRAALEMGTKTSHEKLVDDNAAAIAKGMTYGQYKAWQRRQKELMEHEETGSMA